MAGSYARTDTASATSASNSDDAVTPPTEQAVAYAWRLKRWLEQNDTMEKRTERLVCFLHVEPAELGFSLFISVCCNLAFAIVLGVGWATNPEFRDSLLQLTWERAALTIQDGLRRSVLFLLDRIILPQFPALVTLALAPVALWISYCAIGIPTILLCSAYGFGHLTIPFPFTGPAPLQRVWDAAFVPLVAWRLLVLLEPLAPLSLYANTLMLYLAGTAYFDVQPLARLLDLAIELEHHFKNGRLGKGGDAAAKELKEDEPDGKLRQLEAEVAFLKTQLAVRTAKDPKAKKGSAKASQ
ncbi:hypothetical protein NBRC10512_002788 [Rhodotorula toruloides]|uniref:RHTO0S11e04412g1_1 n=2 Tax=Rhodotorula toruloides TaxID=5286 RepID=A0A061B772_RHOTO|nr:uncharacterized protein RHTO_01668 [Rhodotorula toruloides NP11]EMS21608.1 hypothetical protein RHTO_01668 [Rhodotorula toruloides NP11]CDR45762.1 RHTO0S11e04412g1_1 [Rhodotorula toruloides]